MLSVSRNPNYPKSMIIPHTLPVPALADASGKKFPAMSVGKSIGHMESLQGFYTFVLAGPLAEKDVTGVNGQSMKPDTFKWEMHTFWKELSKEGVDTASLKIFQTSLGALWTGCFSWMQDIRSVVRIKGYTWSRWGHLVVPSGPEET